MTGRGKKTKQRAYLRSRTREQDEDSWSRFSATKNCGNLNLDVVGSKIKRTFEQWDRRDLTIKGKITVAKTLLVSLSLSYDN